MAKYCEICGKGIMSGNNISHSHRKTRRSWAPNIQTTRLVINGVPKKTDVCTRCLRTGKVERAY